MNLLSEKKKYHDSLEIEKKGLQDILPFLLDKAYEGRIVFTNKGNLSEELQKMAGDALFNCENGKLWSVEFKVEENNIYNNFFLETWSNRQRFTLGWMYTLKADILLYYFLDEKNLYSINFLKLKEWAFIKSNIYNYPEKCQNKYDQFNDTWGRCVPISIIQNQLKINQYNFNKP